MTKYDVIMSEKQNSQAQHIQLSTLTEWALVHSLSANANSEYFPSQLKEAFHVFLETHISGWDNFNFQGVFSRKLLFSPMLPGVGVTEGPVADFLK